MTGTLELNIRGMDCADCAQTLERGVDALDGVVECRVSFVTATMHVTGSVAEADVVALIEALGYGVADESQRPSRLTARELWSDTLRRPRNVLTLVGVLVIGSAFVAGWSELPAEIAPALFALGGLAGLYFPVRSGWVALRTGQGLDINVLMTIAAIGAFAIGKYGEAATVIVLFSLGQALEGVTMDRARHSIRSLAMLAPARATVLRPCMDCTAHRGRERPAGAGGYDRVGGYDRLRYFCDKA